MANKELKSITFEGLNDTYTLLTEEEVNTKLSEYAKTSEITQIDIQTVNALPEVGVKGVIYLVPSTLKMTPLLNNRLATVQANTNNSATFSVDKTTNIKAGMTLKLVNNGTMGNVVVKSIDAKTKTITLTKPATLAKGTLIFDDSKYGKDTHEEYIWNPSTNKFERLGIVDVNAVSTATPQSVVARDWNGRAQIENPSVVKDIANKGYVDNTVNNKLSEYAKTSELDKKLDKGNFSITENNITSPVDGKIVAQQTTRLLILSGSNSGNTDDFLDLSKYDSSGIYPESISTWGQEYTNEQLREMFQTAKVDFIPAPYNDWEFVSLTENTDNLVGQYRRTGNTSEVANLTYYLSNASSENANKFKSDYAYLTFDFYSTDVELSERKIWDIVNPDLAVSASSTNAVSGKAVFNALANKADQSAFGNFTFDTDTLKNENDGAEVALGNIIGMPDKIIISQKGINRIDVVHDNAGSWSILDGKVQAFSSDANPVMKEASLFDIINSSEKTDVINDTYGAVIKDDKLGLVNTFMGEAATLTITNLEVLSNGETKSETLKNIIDAPSKIANKQDTLVSGTNIKTINGESVLGSGNISITTPIDNTLSDTSTNAVQNKIVKAAIDGKLNKTTGKQVVYTSNSAGNPSSLPYTTDATNNTIVLRQNNGAIKTGAPVANNDATTKEYVDNASNGKLDKISSLTYEAYVHVGNIQSTMPYTASMDNSAGGDCVVLLGRDSNGRAQVNEPVEDKDIANKKYVDDAISATDISEIAKDYTVLNSKNWSTTYANTGDIGEFGVPDYTSSKYPIIYNQPVNEEVIELAEIINTDTNTTIATFTSKEELGASNAATAYHFGDNYTLLVIHPQDGDYKTMMDGAIPYSSWAFDYCIGVYLTGAITNTSGELWMANDIPTTANLTISFPTPLVAPKGYKTLLDSSYLTRYKYTIYDDGRKECEILACAENVTINSPWGSLYEGTLGSYSFKSGFFTSEPEIHLEMLNTVTTDESGGVACFIETGIKPTTTSTGTLYAVRPNSGATAKKIYFKIYAKQV